jgi:hypothetical protein
MCHQSILDLWENLNPKPDYPKPKGAPKANSYLLALMQQLGTNYTKYRMALVHARINQLKHRVSAKRALQAWSITDVLKMFIEEDLVADGSGGRRGVIHNAGRWSCELARISATCKYYAHPLVQDGLRRSIEPIEGVL